MVIGQPRRASATDKRYCQKYRRKRWADDVDGSIAKRDGVEAVDEGGTTLKCPTAFYGAAEGDLRSFAAN